MQLPFGEWLPDQPDHLKKGANVATNVYYAQNSYKKFPTLVADACNSNGSFSKIFFLISLFISFTCSCVKYGKVITLRGFIKLFITQKCYKYPL